MDLTVPGGGWSLTAAGISSAEEVFGCVRSDAGLMYRILCLRERYSEFVDGVGEKGRRTYGISYSGRRSEGLRRLLGARRLVEDSGPAMSKVNTPV